MAALKEHYDVVIIGFGPVGATLANLLGGLGVTTLVLDREGAAYHLPRAVHFDDEVMRVFQTVGIAAEMAQCTHVNPGMRFVASDGRLLLDWPRPPDVGPQAWHTSYRFHQPELEHHLRQALDRFVNVDVLTRRDVFLVADHGDSVEVRCEHLRTGRLETTRASYVVGCDGARSLVRRFIGTEMVDYGFHERWLVVDALLKRPKPELGDHSVQYCDPTRPATYVRGTGNRRRWEITVRDDEDSAAVATPEETWKLLSRWLTPEEAELERTAVYTFNSRVAQKWRTGRMMIAGDAAHLTPPFMGQGMCAGIRDASNLAWKLAHAVRGTAPDGLLDTYEHERKPHARAYIETAVRLGGLINTADTEAALRAALPGPHGGAATMASIAPRLGDGLCGGNPTHTGMLAQQLIATDGARYDDITGYRFVLITAAAKLVEAGIAPEDITRAGAHLVRAEREPAATAYLTELGAAAVLVRPDRYVLGTAGSSAELQELCAVITNLPMPPA
jgi:3-(3-hydroxy-phenyl)propionate hydroxylase